MKWLRRALSVGLAMAMAQPASGQVQVRLADSTRATYSELHDGLRMGSASADTVARIMALSNPATLWRKSGQALAGKVPWNEGLLALTRLAELQKPAYADSAEQLMHRIMDGSVQGPPGIDPGDLIEPLRAVVLQVDRIKLGDAGMRARPLSSWAIALMVRSRRARSCSSVTSGSAWKAKPW